MFLSFRFTDGIEIRRQINHYKRRNVFVCLQDSHEAFDHRVSVYHVLKEKRCYPHGCVSFTWKCVRFNKGLSCTRGYHRVGKKCFGCKSFVDEKINHRPKLLLSAEDFCTFQNELSDFENWLEEYRGREVNFSGTVFSVKPNLTVDPSRNWRLLFHGFLVVFKKGFVNLVHLSDFCYLKVSGRVQEKYRFRPGDRVDFFARFSEQRGRIILARANRVEFEERAEGFWWNESRARVSLRTGRMVEGQPEKCINCGKGCLVDVKPNSGTGTRINRRLICLEGVRDPRLCPLVRVKREDRGECGVWKEVSSSRENLTTLSNVAISHVI